MSYNVLKFTLDNIIYNCTSKGNEDIEIVLPRRTPTSTTYSSVYSKDKSTVIEPAVQIQIKLILNVTTSKVPKLYIHGEDKKAKVSFSNTLEIQGNSNNILTFTTTNGGSLWLVSRTSFEKVPPTPTEEPITAVNGLKGPTIVLDGNNIRMNNDQGPTIVEQFEAVDNKIINLEQTIVSEVTKDVSTVLPDMIKLQIKDSEIIAEKI